jgi:hypothetical protein
VFADRGEDRFVLDTVKLAREFGAQAGVQDDRIGALEGVDRHSARRAFRQQPFGAQQARAVVKQAGQPGFLGVFAVCSGQAAR